MKYNREQLITGEKYSAEDFLFFWGHQPSRDGRVTKSCFSQWYFSPFTGTNRRISFSTAEHWMMYKKAELFRAKDIQERILNTENPREVKRLGRMINGFSEPVWEEHKCNIVMEGNLLKFSQNEALRDFLLSTESKIIVEASPYDRVWGIGMEAKDMGVLDPARWKGENLLGFALMSVREMLGHSKRVKNRLYHGL